SNSALSDERHDGRCRATMDSHQARTARGLHGRFRDSEREGRYSTVCSFSGRDKGSAMTNKYVLVMGSANDAERQPFKFYI
ncbi:hypothetical protein, partial [Roseobacter sp. TSBP12]|uniref:hypothetical protein n=1 Tax=Roseobacter sp. TSBP12 TaxID=1236613 RepID=UPI001D030771